MTVKAELIDTIFSFSRCMREKSGVKSSIAAMSMVQIQTLVFLAKTKSSSMKAIAEYLHVELPSATSLIDHLFAMGLIHRKQDTNDRRWVKVSLTKKGEKILQQAKKERKMHIESLLSVLSETEKQQMLSLLQKLIKHIEEQHEK